MAYNDSLKFKTYLDCKIECIKSAIVPYTLKREKPANKVIVVSTCYFFSDKLDDRGIGYFFELIANIESFMIKINKYTTNPSQWIYRVYIDKIIFMIDKIEEALSTIKTENTNNECITNICRNYKNNIDIIYFICNFFKKYIEFIKIHDKYSNIEIYTYENKNLMRHLKSNPEHIIAGHIGSFGTLIRYHPLTDERVDVCIMRNCADNFTPLDILIQDYWIERDERKYMEYYDGLYGHNSFDNKSYIKLIQLIYNYNPKSNFFNLRNHLIRLNYLS
jgi:hypothetical protein